MFFHRCRISNIRKELRKAGFGRSKRVTPRVDYCAENKHSGDMFAPGEDYGGGSDQGTGTNLSELQLFFSRNCNTLDTTHTPLRFNNKLQTNRIERSRWLQFPRPFPTWRCFNCGSSTECTVGSKYQVGSKRERHDRLLERQYVTRIDKFPCFSITNLMGHHRYWIMTSVYDFLCV